MEKLQYKLEVFEGPLDMLLGLIAKNKLNIYDIPIAQLLDQYLGQIDRMREADMDIASEFLEMAARLVQIKSASLLPRQEGEADPREDLTGELIEYQQCKAAAAALAKSASFDLLVRSAESIPMDLTYHRTHNPLELRQALLSTWGKGKSLLPPKPESFSALVSRKIVSVTSQVVSVLLLLRKKGRVTFRALFSSKKDRSQRVAAFLAVLELIKSQRIRMEGEGVNSEFQLAGKAGERWIEKN